MNLGTKIKQLRISKGLTQDQLSKLIYKSKRTVEKYENNEIDISIGTLSEIATVLNVSILEILAEDPSDVLNIIKQYYSLEDKPNYNMEKDFSMIIEGFVNRYRK